MTRFKKMLKIMHLIYRASIYRIDYLMYNSSDTQIFAFYVFSAFGVEQLGN